MSFKALHFAFAALCSFASVSSATVVLNLGGANLTNDAGIAIQAGTLIQLVNLGANGQFDAIDISDGSNAGLARWVSGDDAVLDVSFMVPQGESVVAGDFASTKAIDLEFNTGVTPDSMAGLFSRSFQFTIGDLPAGTKLGFRWFPGLVAKDFDSITLALGQSYGQFTRQSPSPSLNGGSHWATPGDGGQSSFDSLITNDFGGNDPNSAGRASLSVVPEPAAIGMSLLGAAGLAMLRRRRA